MKQGQTRSFRSSSLSDVEKPSPINAPTTSWDALIANRRATVGLYIAALLLYGVVIPAELIVKLT